jgi:hypothetical protein
LRYAAQATSIPKIRSCRGRGKAKSGSNTIIRGWHHFLPTFFYGNAVDRTPIISGGSEAVVG